MRNEGVSIGLKREYLPSMWQGQPMRGGREIDHQYVLVRSRRDRPGDPGQGTGGSARPRMYLCGMRCRTVFS
jgi:hypothetical protein